MTTKFYSRVTSSGAYKRFAKSRSLSSREQALLHLVCAHAEFELGTLRTEVAVKQERLEGQIFKTQVAYILGRSKDAAREALAFMVTPFSDHSYTLALPAPAHVQGASEATKPDAHSEEKKPIAASESSESKLLAALPEWARSPIRLAADYLGKLSPLTTAILFFLIVSGSVAYANHKYGTIENSYKLVVEENDRLKSVDQKLADSDAKLELEKQKLQQAATLAEGLKERIKNLEAFLGEKKRDMDTLKAEHQAALAAAMANLDVATKDAMKKQDDRITALEGDNQKLRDDLQNANVQLQVANSAPSVEDRLKKMSDLVQSLQGQKKALERDSKDLISLTALTIDTLSNVKANLLDNDPKYTTKFRGEFKRIYGIAYSRDRELFERLGLPDL